tara:strand:- start:76 stop:504 length:429 start_codon:yes stop_codon:yes gene_type:complete
MKKLLIILLFVGFSFGQDKTLLVGVWDCINCGENNYYRYIFKKDGSSIISVTLDGTSETNNKIKWENFKIRGNDFVEEGVLTVDFIIEVMSWDYSIFDYSIIKKQGVEQFKTGLNLSTLKSDIKNDILILINEKRIFVFEKK